MRYHVGQILSRTPRGLILNFGPSGTGKTRALYTLIKAGLKKGWIFDFDYGVETLVRLLEKDPTFNEDDLTIFRYKPLAGDRLSGSFHKNKEQGKEIWEQFKEDWNSLFEFQNQKTGEWKEDKPGPDWVCIDSESTLLEIIMDFVLCMQDKKHDLYDPGTDARKDYGYQMGKAMEVIKSAQTLPCLVIFNFHEKNKYKMIEQERGDPIKSLEGIEPLITGEMSTNIGKEFHVVVYSKLNGENYRWQTKPGGLIRTGKSRFKEGLKSDIEQDYSLVLDIKKSTPPLTK